MARRYRKSGMGCGVLVVLVMVGLGVTIVQKIWPLLIGAILVWAIYHLSTGRKTTVIEPDYVEDSPPKVSPTNLTKDSEYESSNFITVKSLNLFGQAVHSKNKLFTLVWSSSDINADGSRNAGRYAILIGDDVIKTGPLKGLTDGKIANNSSFIFSRSLNSAGLASEIRGFNKEGTELLSYSFKALTFNNGISEDGKYAICQTANAPGDDGGKLYLFDLQQGTLLWKKTPESGWAYKYDFDTENGFVYLIYLRLGKFRYDIKGNFLDYEKWMEARIDKGSGTELAYIASDLFKKVNKNTDETEFKKILDVCDLAFKRGFENNPRAKAMAFRVQGEVFDHKGDLVTAKDKYEQALATDPKIGVKRRLDILNKK